MKREIKFRGRRIKDGEWVYGDLLQNRTITHISNFDNRVNRELYEVYPDSVGQFTGLKDKNGKEIYEGDIQQDGSFVKWNGLHCCWAWFTENGMHSELVADMYDGKGKLLELWQNLTYEIIGNIYENPELIKL